MSTHTCSIDNVNDYYENYVKKNGAVLIEKNHKCGPMQPQYYTYIYLIIRVCQLTKDKHVQEFQCWHSLLLIDWVIFIHHEQN